MQRSRLPFAQCQFCHDLTATRSADKLNGETLPALATQLIGMSDEQINDEQEIVFCPYCFTPYLYECTAAFMEHHVSLERLALPEARAYFSDEEYDAIINELSTNLDHPEAQVQTYAARSLAHHHLLQGDTASLLKNLQHPQPIVCIHTLVILLAHCDHLEPYIPTLITLLTDSRPNVRINAIRAFTTYTESHKPEIRWGGESLLTALMQGSLHDHGYEFAKIVKVAINEGIEVTATLPALITLLEGQQPLAPSSAAETLWHFVEVHPAQKTYLQQLLLPTHSAAAALLKKKLE